MSESTAAALAGLFGGVLLGLAARIGRFCTLGAIEDTLYQQDTRRLQMWGFAIALSVVFTFALASLDQISLDDTVYLSVAWSPLLSIVGGLMFGLGMALTGSCGFGSLARMGGGDLRSFLVVLVMGVAALMTISGPFAEARVWATAATSVTSDTSGYAELLGEVLRTETSFIGMLLGALAFFALFAFGKFKLDGRILGWACVVAIAITSGWWGTAFIASEGFESANVVSHTYSAPLGQTLIYVMTSSGGGLDFAVGSVFGVVLGAFVGSLLKGQFRWEACEDARELRRQILGAFLMGVGAVLALGCTVGQGLSAFSVLAFSAPVVFISIFVGAAFGLRYLIEGRLWL